MPSFFRRLLDHTPRTTTPARRKTFRPALENLEAREVPSVTSATRNSSGGVVINTNTASDHVVVNLSGSNIVVEDRTFTTPKKWTFTASTVSSISFYGNGGNDKIYSYVNKTLYAYGGTGNDYLYGGTGKNYLYGGDGADTLLGDVQTDYLYGGWGNDSLYGYGSVDRLYGEGDNDYLSGGSSDDFMIGGAGFDRYKDDFVKTKWVISFNPTDVAQEASPICTIASAIAAAAHTTDLGPDFRYLGNNVYQVRLVKNGAFNYQKVAFDGTWNDNDLRPTEWRTSTTVKTGQLNGEFWTLLYARAYLQLNGVNWRDTNTNNWGSAWKDHNKALYAMTGWKVTSEFISTTESTSTASWLRSHMLDDDAITIGGTGHAYMVKDAYQSGGTWYVKLYNPWGYDGVHQSSLNYTGGASDGYLTVSWAEIRQNFKYAYVANG